MLQEILQIKMCS